MDQLFISFGVDRQGMCDSSQTNLFQNDMVAFF